LELLILRLVLLLELRIHGRRGGGWP
jgi:hypothetical protein